jgi:hypothetical protein
MGQDWVQYSFTVDVDATRELSSQEIENITRKLFAQIEEPYATAVDVSITNDLPVTEEKKSNTAAMVVYSSKAYEIISAAKIQDGTISENILLAILAGMIQKIEEGNK